MTMTQYKLLPMDLETHLGDFESACRIALKKAETTWDLDEADDVPYWKHQLATIEKIKEQIKKTPSIAPVAYTSQEQLDKAKKYPSNNLVMWGEPLPHHDDIPLYTSPPVPDRQTIQWVVNLLGDLVKDRIKEHGRARAADEYIGAIGRYVVSKFYEATGVKGKIPEGSKKVKL